MRYNPNPSVLAALTDDQQNELLAWLDLYPIGEVLKKVAAPPPEGFGITTYPNSLKRFYARHRVNTLADESTLATEMLSTAAYAGDFDAATIAALRQIAFQITNSPGFGPSQFKAVSRWILKLRDQEQTAQALQLARERLALEREKAELNAARLALKYQMALQEIIQDQSSDDEDKIRAARDLIFGPSASPTVGDEVTSLSSDPSKIQN